MKVKLLITLFFITTNLLAQSNNSFIFSQSAANSVSVEFKTSKMKSDIIYGAGVSFFYNKGNKGKDYTGFAGIDPIGFVNDSYENVLSKSGSIFFIIGNKINKNLFCNFRFGVGVLTRYYNGIGLPGFPDERWYVRRKGANDLLSGFNMQYNIGNFSLSGGWDNFNEYNFGFGFNFNNKNN